MATPVQLQAPNGVKWSQPTGLFIDNSFVKAASGETLTSIDPAYVTYLPHSPAVEILLSLSIPQIRPLPA